MLINHINLKQVRA
ncbi:uncharacterized protein FTOL_13590 [Fusarium torulosum]|uniref:Uncharacterized protein n=1 Tax=Fusarium torulosum TaxID=33205 RepID=A0AAE8SQD6_9HYPO|nr:uncharacterized protein FTOL_13590 [Fusarium torulosum]